VVASWAIKLVEHYGECLQRSEVWLQVTWPTLKAQEERDAVFH
jgi:hypothetical protein